MCVDAGIGHGVDEPKGCFDVGQPREAYRTLSADSCRPKHGLSSSTISSVIEFALIITDYLGISHCHPAYH